MRSLSCINSNNPFLFRIFYVILALISIICLWNVRPKQDISEPVNLPNLFVSVSGHVKYPAVYPVSANSMADSVIKMAVPKFELSTTDLQLLSRMNLSNGDALHVTQKVDAIHVTISSMPVSEKMLFNVPLDINLMSAEDFEQLEGVGPVMAYRIVEYRQKNGGAMAVNELKNVSGIGESKYHVLKKYFK